MGRIGRRPRRPPAGPTAGPHRQAPPVTSHDGRRRGRRPVCRRPQRPAGRTGPPGGTHAAAHARRGGRPGPPAGAREAAPGADRGRPPVVGDPVGPARDRQDHPGQVDRRRHPQGVRAHVRGHGGVKDVRDTVAAARRLLAEQDRGTIFFLDEVHRFNRSQQDALLPSVEDGTLVLVGATTENPFFSVNAPLLSRSTLFRLQPLDDTSLGEVVQRALTHEEASADADAVAALIGLVDGDARAALTSLGGGPGLGAGPARHRRRRGSGPQRPGHPLRGGRSLRRDLGLHQVHPGLGRGRRAVLAGPDAGRRRGRPVRGPAPGHPGQRGHRHGRPHGPAGGRRCGPGGRVRRACPKPSSTWPRR